MQQVFSVTLCAAVMWLCAAGCTFDSSGLRWLAAESECGNGMDDDGDGFVDCADSDCGGDPACNNNNNVNNTNGNNSNPGPEYCTNGLDDDGDGLVDCADPQCALAPTCQNEDCGNGADDDADGLVDCADPDCGGSPLCVPEECTNGFDDDSDGLVDCADPECAAAPHCQPESCGNDVDDDGDNLVDCDDPDCLGSTDCGLCHPITGEGCSAGEACYLNYTADWFGYCEAQTGSGGQWDSCSWYSDCQLGYYCSGSYTACLRVCHPGGGDCSSIGGTYCQPFSDFGSASPWGICVL